MITGTVIATKSGGSIPGSWDEQYSAGSVVLIDTAPRTPIADNDKVK